MRTLPICTDISNSFVNCSLPFKHPLFALTTCAICFVCFFASLLAIRILQPKHQIKIHESKHVPADLMNYVLPYVVSFISLDYQDSSKFIGFLIFLGWLFWVTYQSGQIIMNPMLAVFGWKLYEAKYSFIGSPNILIGRVLTQVEPIPNQICKQISIQDILIVK